MTPDRKRLLEEVEAVTWYQTIQLPHGVKTPGTFDTIAAAPKSLLPADLTGKRCLDVASANGFWAFEMERRGAAEVVAIDLFTPDALDLPNLFVPDRQTQGNLQSPLVGFELAHRALESKVKHETLSVYEVSREQLGGFDVVFVGSVLLHLRDPIRALTRLHDVTDGILVLNESFDVPLSLLRRSTPAARLIGAGLSKWWVATIAGLRQMVHAAGFETTAVGRPYPLRWGRGFVPTEGADRQQWLRRQTKRVLGIPHVSLAAKPRTI